ACVVVCGYVFFFQAEDGIRDFHVTGVQTCALPIFLYANADENTAMVIVNREMEFNGRLEKMLFTLIWEKTDSGWIICKESVSVRSEERRVGRECRYCVWSYE